MEAFIAGVELGKWRSRTAIELLFAGYNFGYKAFPYPELREFKEEYHKDVRQVLDEINSLSPVAEFLIFKGGEPLLQRPVVELIAEKSASMQLSNVLFTNASKCLALKRVLEKKLFSTIVISYPAPLNQRFEKVARAATFFKPAEEIVKDIKHSFEIIKQYASENNNLGVVFETRIIPGLLFRKQDLLKMAADIMHIPCEWHLKASTLPGLEQPSRRFLNSLKEAIIKQYPNMTVIV